ncbi:MAG: hypothetical protein WCF26_13825 [Candidatus Sulfotelmatobacter sp.]
MTQINDSVAGGTQVEFSNMTLVFGAPASDHFDSQPINGAVTRRWHQRQLRDQVGKAMVSAQSDAPHSKEPTRAIENR